VSRPDPEPVGAPGGVIGAVRPGSIADEMGLRPGDRVYEVNGSRVEDYIDYRFRTAESHIEVRVVRPDGQELVCEIEKDPDEDLGVEFTHDIFGGPKAVRRCRNRCLFCFVDRLPGGLRPSLYLKDDDYRLSFLHGNFISLTNVTPADEDRILGQRLSPLYVSVHTTDGDLRARLMGSERARDIMPRLERLTRGGITIHAQVVVCPGINDGDELERTVRDLVRLRPGVASVGVVPVGLTRFGPPGPVRPLTEREAADLTDLVMDLNRELGGFVFPADELLIQTGRTAPPAGFYQGFPQLQNGIGLARRFLDDLEGLGRGRRPAAGERKTTPSGRTPAAGRVTGPAGPRAGGPKEFMVVTGSLARPLVEEAVRTLAAITGLEGRVVEVPNRFLGTSVTVAGLLTGSDIVRVLGGGAGPGDGGAAPGGGGSQVSAHGPVLVPGAALRAGSGALLDGLSLADLQRQVGRPFVDAGWLPSHMLEVLGQMMGGSVA